MERLSRALELRLGHFPFPESPLRLLAVTDPLAGTALEGGRFVGVVSTLRPVRSQP